MRLRPRWRSPREAPPPPTGSADGSSTRHGPSARTSSRSAPGRPSPTSRPGVAAAAAALAIGLGIWNASLAEDLDTERAATALLADPNAAAVSLDGADGRLVVSPTGQAALVVSLDPAPSGKTYEAWVIRDGEPTRAGLFEAEAGRDVLLLDEPVGEGETVAVTLERDGGVDAPTGEALLTATLS